MLRERDRGRQRGICLGVQGEGSPEQSGQLATRTRKTAHFCGLRFKTKEKTLRFCPAQGPSLPPGFRSPLLAEGPGQPTAAGLLSLFWGSSPSPKPRHPPSKFASAPRPARRLRPATCAHLPGTLKALGWAPEERGSRFFFLF